MKQEHCPLCNVEIDDIRDHFLDQHPLLAYVYCDQPPMSDK